MEPFKNFFNPQIIAMMGRNLRRVWPSFDEGLFVKLAEKNLEQLELKERSIQIKDALVQTLPKDFKEAAPIILASLHPEDNVDLSAVTIDERGIRGWAAAPLCHYVGERGLADFELGMEVERQLTSRFTSEFGIRFFILADSDRALKILKSWTTDDNYHVRRLVSEGSRPRLPWAMQLIDFIKDPTPVLPLLEALKDDPEEYVRRSVANHLNDIAKDHPNLVADIAKKWMKGASKDRQRLVRHACRTLVKNGHPEALKALGYGKAKVALRSLTVQTPVVRFGEALIFEVEIASEASEEQNLMLDYVVHHRKANGKTSPKVFKWKAFKLAGGKSQKLSRKHAIRPITTRVYYPGTHHLEIQVNGEVFGRIDFELAIED